MKKVYILGKVRGFFRHLTQIDCETVQFLGATSAYEVNRKYKTHISALLRTRVAGFWGVFAILSTKNAGTDCDCYLSYNRFARSRKPYLIYLENPTALCNYSLTCLNSPFVKKKLRRCLNDPSLKKIICMSKSCERTLEQVLGVPVPKEKITQIYPYVPENPLVSEQLLIDRCSSETVRLLFVTQGAYFYSKGGAEILASFASLRSNYPLSLTIITHPDMLDPDTIRDIHRLGVDLRDFHFNSTQMQQIYAEHTILLHPSSADSFGLTMLEALKAGMTVIASDMYAFKEMVVPGENGYLLTPTCRLFDQRDLPNPSVWNHRSRTLYAKRFNPCLADDLSEKIKLLCENRALLTKMSLASYRRSAEEFSEKETVQKWEGLLSSLG